MKKLLALALFSVLGSTQAFAASSVVGIIDEDTGDLIIQVLDDPGSAPPYEAAELWSAIRGDEPNKQVKSEVLEIKCNTDVNEPTHYRYGSCAIEVRASKVIKLPEGEVGMLINGVEAQKILGSLVGSEDPNHPWSKEVRLAGGKFLISADHPRKLFALRIAKELIH